MEIGIKQLNKQVKWMVEVIATYSYVGKSLLLHEQILRYKLPACGVWDNRMECLKEWSDDNKFPMMFYCGVKHTSYNFQRKVLYKLYWLLLSAYI